ncbi:MAG: hypothetical protein SPJ30_09490, partial [Faecalibacterium sp.]|nr:hypothetical protein [Faecalibacterium sp.]
GIFLLKFYYTCGKQPRAGFSQPLFHKKRGSLGDGFPREKSSLEKSADSPDLFITYNKKPPAARNAVQRAVDYAGEGTLTRTSSAS